MKSFPLIYFTFLVFIAHFALGEDDKIIFLTACFRHGARHMVNPLFYNIVEDSDYKMWPGRLTNIGKHQLHLAGRQFAYIYGSKVSEIFNPETMHQSLIVRAAGLNRTIESAQSLLSGIYPHGLGPSLNAYQMENIKPPIKIEGLTRIKEELRDAALPNFQRTVPIHTTNAKKDKIFSPHTECNTFQDEESDFENYFKSIDNKYSKLYDKLNEELPINLRQKSWNSDFCYLLQDNINAAEGNNIKLTVNLAAETKTELAKCSLDNTFNRFLASHLKSKLLSHPILYDSANYFSQAVENAKNNTLEKTKRAEIFLISDTHIMALHKMFKWELTEFVPFASSLVFELHMKTNGAEKTFYVKAKYNKNEMPLGEYANYENFIKFILENTFKDEHDYLENCTEQEDNSDYDKDTYMAVTIILFVVFILIWGSNWFIMTRKPKKPEEPLTTDISS